MFVYNITVKIIPGIETDWVNWQKQEHIPEIMATGLFTEYRLYKLMDVEETDGLTYVVQFYAESKLAYEQYLSVFAPALRKKSFDKWGDQFIAFRTIMQHVH